MGHAPLIPNSSRIIDPSAQEPILFPFALHYPPAVIERLAYRFFRSRRTVSRQFSGWKDRRAERVGGAGLEGEQGHDTQPASDRFQSHFEAPSDRLLNSR